MNIQSLMGTDLDGLTEVITGALHEVHEEHPAAAVALPGPGTADSKGTKEGNREPLTAAIQNQEQDIHSKLKSDVTVKQEGE